MQVACQEYALCSQDAWGQDLLIARTPTLQGIGFTGMTVAT